MKQLIMYLFLILATGFSYGKILMKPYLQALSNNSVIVMVETDNNTPVTVNYGQTRNTEMKATTSYYIETEKRRNNTFVHRIKLENLKNNSVYFYKAMHSNDESEILKFRTPPQENTPILFSVMGDNRSNPFDHSRKSKKMKRFEPLFSIYTGDLCFDGRYETWKSEFFTEDELSLISEVPFFNSIGNHEGMRQNSKAFLEPANKNSGNDFYYSFDIGNIHFLVLNTEQSVKKGSNQWKFAEEDLKNSGKKWKIAVFHIPAYAGGGHNGSKDMIKMTSELFEKYEVDACLTGHNHYYQRNYVNKIYHLVFGGGGSPLYEPKNEDFTQISVKDFNYGIFEVFEDKINVSVYNLKDEKIDSFLISK